MPREVRAEQQPLVYRVVGITALSIFLADLLVKTYLRLNFAYQSIPVVKNIFHITVIFNTGAAFGILRGNSNLLTYISILFVAIFISFIRKEEKRDRCFLIACGLILGGAISNLSDRVFLGFIVDYLDFRIWPVFNLSDSGITIGVGLLLFQSLRKPPKRQA